MGRKRKSFDVDAGGGASHNAYGRDRGKAGTSKAMGLRQGPTLGPVPISQARATLSGPMGLTFHNIQSHPDNADEVKMILYMQDFTLKGYFDCYANGSALITNGAIDWVNAIFWTQYYEMLWHMAQRRDGYRATAAPPLTSPTVPRELMELAVMASCNARRIDAWYGACLVNEGMRASIEAFDDINPDRITRAIERTNQFMYPEWLVPIINYHSSIFTNRPNGPVFIPMFDFQRIEDELVPASGAYTAWSSPPNIVASNIGWLLDDIDLACTQILDGNVADLADADNYHSLLDMMGHVTPAPPRTTLKVDPGRFADEFKSGGFFLLDTKGVGVDTSTFWPDMRGSEDTLVSVHLDQGVQMDELFWIGAKGIYAWDADDDDTPGYTAKANDLTAYGMVMKIDPAAGTQEPSYGVRLYTREDGITLGSITALDLTAAADLQALLWQYPWLTCHPDIWRCIMSEEDEEAYRHGFEQPTVQVPAGTWGRYYREWLIEKSNMPFTT